MSTTEDRHDDKSRRFCAAILEVLRWEAEGLYRRSNTKDYTCMVAAIGEVTLLGAATPHLDDLLRVMETGTLPSDLFQSWEGQAAFSVWHTRENIGAGGDSAPNEPLEIRVSRARAAVRLAAARGLDMRRYAVSWFGSSVYRGVLIRGGSRGDFEVLLPWADVEAERMATAVPRE